MLAGGLCALGTMGERAPLIIYVIQDRFFTSLGLQRPKNDWNRLMENTTEYN